MHFARTSLLAATLLMASVALSTPNISAQEPRVIEILATKDSQFKIPGQKGAPINVKPGEVIRLRITAQKGSEWTKEGYVHGFLIKELKDQGWDLQLKEGTQEFTLTAPQKPGEYLIECSVKCSSRHESMHARLIVKP